MPPQIAFIPPDSIIAARARDIARKMGLEQALIIREGIGDAARANAVDLEREGVDVIITRGITLDAVQRCVQTPVVEIPVSGQDLATALHEAKKFTGLERPRIGLMAFASAQHDVETFAELLGIDLVVYRVRNDIEYIREQANRAKAEGINIVVAGTISCVVAREQGMPALMLDAGEVSIRAAFHEARTVAYARRLEKMRTRRLQSVVDLSQSGVVVLDAERRVQAVNVKARQILRMEAEFQGGLAGEVLPEPFRSRCVECDGAIIDEVLEIHGTPLLLSADITRMGGEILDIIFTLQPVAAIGELESKLRKSMHSRGLTCQYSFADIWGVSPALRAAIAMARSFAATGSSVLLVGETGTGKELFAQAIHTVSPYASGPFVAVNCAALPPSLLESELFGHEEGAFTGARRNGKQGLFEMAHNGTIFLDEVTEMDHYGQTRLLRVLQERCVMRVGGNRYIPVTARVIAASNQDMARLVEQGKFRRDLYYRLNVLPLVIPPLRERAGDVVHLARRFTEMFRKKYAGPFMLTPDLIELFEKHVWSGNVRELSAIIERLTLLARTMPISPTLVAATLASYSVTAPGTVRRDAGRNPGSDAAHTGGRTTSMEKGGERERIMAALEEHGGHQGRAAQSLGMHRTTLIRKMRAMNIRLHRTAL